MLVRCRTRASRHGGLMAAGRTLDAFVLVEHVGILGRTTRTTDEALRPARRVEVVHASFGVGKPTSKLKNGGLEEDSVFPHAPSFLRAGPPCHGGDTLHLVLADTGQWLRSPLSDVLE